MSEFERKSQDLDNEARKSCMGLGDVPDVSPAPLKPHPSCLNTPFRSVYMELHRSLFHCFISALVRVTWFPDPCLLVSRWHCHKAQMLTWLPPESLWTPAVSSSSYCSSSSQLVHLCSASVPMMADSGRTLTLELLLLEYVGEMTCSAEVCVLFP